MRKDKDSKDFVWWPSFHQGLHDYYQQLNRYGAQRQPYPASNIKHHPCNGWGLPSGSSYTRYMPFVVQPEQRLLHSSEHQLYEDLIWLREQSIVETQLPLETPVV